MGAFDPDVFDGGSFYTLFADCIVGLGIIAFSLSTIMVIGTGTRLWDAHTARKKARERASQNPGVTRAAPHT